MGVFEDSGTAERFCHTNRQVQGLMCQDLHSSTSSSSEEPGGWLSALMNRVTTQAMALILITFKSCSVVRKQTAISQRDGNLIIILSFDIWNIY